MPAENKSRSSWIVYCALAAVWLLLVGWLWLERTQVDNLARQGVLNRARDISNTIALVSRSGPPGAIPQSRLEKLLGELVSTTELRSVTLLNAAGETVASSGEALSVEINKLPSQGAQWNRRNVVIVNLVDFGQSAREDGTPEPPPVVISRSDEESGRRRFRRVRVERSTTFTLHYQPGEMPLPPMPPFFSEIEGATPTPAAAGGENTNSAAGWAEKAPEGHEQPIEQGPGRDERMPSPGEMAAGQEGERQPPPPPPQEEDFDRRRDHRDGEPPSRSVFHRPFWMDQKRYEELLAKRGLHGFVFVMSTEKMRAELDRDLCLRVGMAVAALLAVMGLGLGWRGLVRATDLQIRLVRAQEMNEHLREMNLAAAGLAHEARNPLNIVRGIAQIIDKDAALPDDVHGQAERITEEVDRVTQRLNEFIKYSRPMQPRPGATPIAAVVADVLTALQSDMEDKRVASEVRVPAMYVLADESMLRQVVFNLVINAIQAVSEGGRVVVSFAAPMRGEGVLSVEDNGPGVAPELRDQVFHPYFTTHAQGSGLGLSVVKQIALAHHWEIECGTSEMGGAAFRIHGLKTVDTETEAKS